MSDAATVTGLLAPGQDYLDDQVPAVDVLQIQKRYGEEAGKRMRADGNNQFVDISLDDRFASFLDDPWVEEDAIRDLKSMFPSNRCEMLIIGAGFGGLLYAIRMIEAGVKREDIRIIDSAGGFGGTWYWNRYPGLHSDIESYCYLPLLEETGYVPRHRFARGEEIRSYINMLAEKWGISPNAVFQTDAQKLVWGEESKEWEVKLTQRRNGKDEQSLSIRSRFVVMSNGVLNWPKLPGVPGVLDYQGDLFHTSRWNYGVTGGSPTDPSLTKLQDKRVAIVGTAATAVEVVPQLARWAKHVYVVQRTPASLANREQRETDPEWFKKNVSYSKGWQRERMRNFHEHMSERPPSVNMCDDEWTRIPSLIGLAGNPDGPRSMEDVPAYLEKLHTMDAPRLERLRKHIDTVVRDPIVAEKLKPWYPSWCKRPLFHDQYLSTFNRENVTLVDTEGKGLERLTSDSIVAAGQTYPVDVVIFSTGYRAPFTGSPAEKANVTIVGRDRISMSEEWARNGPSTLHGVLDCNFPSLFLSGPWQASNSPNYVFTLDFLAKHSAHILADAKRKAGGKPFAVSTTRAAADDWGMQVLMRSFPGAAVLSCTPGYFNVEGDIARASLNRQMVIARSGVWGHGIEDFLRTVEAWYETGDLQGVSVQT